jgi:pyruvate dehydrogenase E1 component alpha subunit
MGTTIERASSAVRMVDKAKGYKIPAKRVDGNNVLEVYAETGKAIKAARTKGPQFLEMMTYRFEGHSMGDPLRYRSKEEVEERKARDPITFLVSHLIENKMATEKELDEIDGEVAAEIEEAQDFAINSPLPALDTLYDHVYVES